MRASVCLVCLCLVLGATTGCADARSTSPTAPASLPDSLAAGPGADYDASGSWHIDAVTPSTGETEEFDVVFHQDANGNITFLEEEGATITLTRLGPGNGRVITYRISFFGEEPPCHVEGSGTVTLDTQTNTGRATVRLSSKDCHEGFTQTAILTKN